jgi:hypothetical protein
MAQSSFLKAWEAAFASYRPKPVLANGWLERRMAQTSGQLPAIYDNVKRKPKKGKR